MSVRVFTVLILLVVACGAAYGQDGFPLVFDVSPVLWGLDLGVGYKGISFAPGMDTILWIYGGGAYEQMTYERLPDGTLISGQAPETIAPGEDPFYNRWSARWQLGIAQGIVWNPRVEANLLEAFLFYRGRADFNLRSPTNADQLLFLSSIPDRNGIFQNALLLGVKFNDLLFDPRHKTSHGVSGEVSAEWGPAFFFNTLFGSSDYLRFNVTARAFLPILDAAPERRANLFSVYLCDFLSADYVLGKSVPLNIRQTFGGLDPRTGLGNALRGADAGSLDVNLKLVNNFEARANMPALWFEDLVPGVLVYWDAGWYDQVGEPIAAPGNGFVTSVGAGVFLDVFDLTSLTGYLNYRLTGVNADGSRLTFSFDFAAKF
jgi:hypothetical protein